MTAEVKTRWKGLWAGNPPPPNSFRVSQYHASLSVATCQRYDQILQTWVAAGAQDKQHVKEHNYPADAEMEENEIATHECVYMFTQPFTTSLE